MQLKTLVDEISYKLGQYVFTEMYTLDNIIGEINDVIDDTGTYQIVRDFTFCKYDNINWSPFLAQTDVTAATYTMPRQIWRVINAWSVESNRRIPLNPVKYWDFSNRNNPGQPAHEYYTVGNTIYLSEAHDVVVEFCMSPAHHTSADYYSGAIMNIPDDFKWFLKDRALANMMPIFMSDGQLLADKYFEKSEIRIKRLADKYGRKLSNTQMTAAMPGKTLPQWRTARNPYTEERL